MQRQIHVKLAIAWGMALAMRFADALQLVDQAEEAFSNEVDADVLRCECQTIRAVVAGLQDDSRKALTLAEECLQSTDTWTANVASNAARFGRWKAGDFAGFYGVPWIPFPAEEEKRNGFASVHRLCLQGLVEIDQLRLDLSKVR